MLMLLCAVTAWAQTDLPVITTDPTNPVYYIVYNTRSKEPGGLMYYAGDNIGIKDGCTSAVLEDKYKFYFTGSHDALYVHNAATDMKLAGVASWTTEGTVWCVKQREDGYLAFGPQGAADDEQKWWNEKNYATNDATSDFTVWYSYDEGSAFVIEPADNYDNYVFPETGKFYTIECPLFEKVQGVAKGLVAWSNDSLSWNTVDLTDKNFYWVPTVNTDGTVVLKNLGTGLYISGTAVSETETNATIYALGANQFAIYADGKTIHANGHNGGLNSNGGIVDYKGAAGSASAWSFVERKDPDAVTEVTVIYNFVYEGAIKYTQEYNTLVGEQYQAITVTHPLGVSVVTAAPTGEILAEDVEVVDGVNTITKSLEVAISNVPFAYSDSYATVSWQFLKFDSSNNFYLYHNDELDYIALDSKNFDPDNDNYYWGFIGNPFDGYKIVNKGAGEGYILSSSTTMSGTTGDGTWPIMTAAASLPEGNNELWIPTASASAENGIFLAQKGHSWNRMNNRTVDGVAKLAYWTAGASAGSTFVAESPAEALSELVEAFKTRATAALGYVGGYPVEMADAIEAISSYDAMKNFIADNKENHIAFDANKYYRIYNVFRNSVVVATTAGQRVPATESNTDINQVWKFEAGETEGTYLIKSLNANAYMQAVGASNTLAETGAEFELYYLSDGLGQFNLKQKGSSNLMCIYANGNVGSWTDGGVDSDMAWYLIPVSDLEALSHTLTVGAAGYTTLALGYNATVPAIEGDGNGVFTATVNGEWIDLTAVAAGSVLPANTAVIIKAAADTELSFAYSAETAAEVTTDLLGTLYDKNIAPGEGNTAYILSKQNEVVGFYKAALNQDEGTAFKNNGHKAYLVVDGAEGAAYYSFRFPGTTGVEEITDNREQSTVIYDLTGRRVEAITAPGIYIVNGKKTLVK